MRIHYSFSQQETDTIIQRYGQHFYNKVQKDIATYADQWSLTGFQLIPAYSANVVFTCESASFGPAVLKMAIPSNNGAFSEYHTLREYSGKGFCSVFDVDLEHGIILEERIQPGETLREEQSLERRLDVFCTLYSGLHIEPNGKAAYPTYLDWVLKITGYMNTRKDCVELFLHMDRAKQICLALMTKYSRQMLLHGDFHHDNILRGNDAAYKIIDPKGVIGDPVFDVPRFILNEFAGELSSGRFVFDIERSQTLSARVRGIITTLANKLNIPEDVLKQCLYVETVMGMCWCVEDGATTDEHKNLLATAEFVDMIMKE